MLIDDTNYWKTEEKMFRELMPRGRSISTAKEACNVVEVILSKRVSKKRKYWLLMFALTDRELMRPDPERVFESIMGTRSLTAQEKAFVCLVTLRDRKPFKLEYVLPPEQVITKHEEVKARATKGLEELRQRGYHGIMEEGFESLDKLVTRALGLPEVTTETYSLPYFRLFPAILPRYAILWRCRLGEEAPTELVVRYGLEETEGSGEDRRPFFLGAMDIIREFRSDVDESLIDEFLRKGKAFPHIGVRKAVYRLGVELCGSEFLQDGLKDASSAVRKAVERLKVDHP